MSLSVIVPTYNETDNIRPLTERLFRATRAAKLETELLVMDDESDGTAETERLVGALAKEGYAVRIHVRRRGEGKGLSSAVLLGFELAKHGVVLCMDADLQHEPESVPAVARPVLDNAAEFTVGSRHVGDGGLGFDWSLSRRVISAGATMLARPLSSSTDPMSGFFCLSRETLARGKAAANPVGFKIGLELAVRCGVARVTDVPITFQERVAGESKLSMKQNVLYLRQLLALYWFKFKLTLLALAAALVAVAYLAAQKLLG